MKITRNHLPGIRRSMKHLRRQCVSVRVLVDEMYGLVSGDLPVAGACGRRSLCHLRQVAMYVCHVALRMTMTEIGLAYGRDRTTVGHACRTIEDRRDDRAYDDFVSAVERAAGAIFGISSEDRHEQR